MKSHAIFLATATLLISTPWLPCQAETTTEPVGYNKVVCLPQSETVCSAPFDGDVPFVGTLGSAPSLNGSTATLTATESTSWTSNAFGTFYFVRLTNGPMAGTYFQIVGNTNNQVTIDLAGADFSSVTMGTSFKISKFWTLRTLFPPATQTAIVPSLGNLLTQRRTEIYLPNNAASGTNIPPAGIYYLVGTTEWRKSVSGSPEAGDTILWPDTYFTIRHGHSSITESTQLITLGNVELTSLVCPLAVLATGPQDNFVTHGRPVPIKLSQLGFDSSSFVSSLTNLLPTRKDQLFTYDNNAAQLNKPPTAIYYKVGDQWRKSTSGFPVADDDVIMPGTGFIVRKYTAPTSGSVLWRNDLPQP